MPIKSQWHIHLPLEVQSNFGAAPISRSSAVEWMDLVIDQLGAEHKKASEDPAGSKVDDRAVLGNESTGGSDLVEMSEHDRIHVGEHDPPRA